MTDQNRPKNRPTLAELRADGLTPEIMIEMIDAEKAMAGEYVCSCGVAGDDQKEIEACQCADCYFRRDGVIDAPYLGYADLHATRKHYEALADEAAASEAINEGRENKL